MLAQEARRKFGELVAVSAAGTRGPSGRLVLLRNALPDLWRAPGMGGSSEDSPDARLWPAGNEPYQTMRESHVAVAANRSDSETR